MTTEIEYQWEDCSIGFYCPICRKEKGIRTTLIVDSQNEKETCNVCGKFEYQLSAKIKYVMT